MYKLLNFNKTNNIKQNDMKTKLFSTKDGVVLYEDENGRLISSNMKAVKAAMMEDIKKNDIPFDYKMGSILVINRIKAQEEAN